IAALLRGGRLPQADVSPAARRATCELLRRRIPLRRQRAARLAHVPHTTSPYNRPAMGKTIADPATRAGGAERFAARAVHKSREGDLALLDDEDRLRTDLALPSVKRATPHEVPTFYRRRSIPGVGQRLARGLL